MRADYFNCILDFGMKLHCDKCGRLCEEGYCIKPESEEELDQLEKAFGGEINILFLCEDCLYKTMSLESTRIYSASGRRLRECENNLKGFL